jgi:S-phase kinase-associated protein 1
MITLTSQDKKEFLIDISVAQRSVLLKNLLEDVGETDGPIPLLLLITDFLTFLVKF